MTRSNAREIASHLIFEQAFQSIYADDQVVQRFDTPEYLASLSQESDLYSEQPSAKQREYITTVVRGVQECRDTLDAYIEQYAIGWNLKRISEYAKAAMRLAMYEILYVEDVPERVAVNEALELIRKYEDEDMVSFVNGVLGAFTRREQKTEADQ